MADNVLLPATGTGTASVTQATDDVSGVHYPVVKLADGTADGTGRIGGDATNGLDVDVTRLPVVTGSGSFTAQNNEVKLTLTGQANATFQLTGTWSATVVFEASNDNSAWTSIYSYKAGDGQITSAVTGSAGNDIYRCTVAGFGYVRCRCSAYTSGTVVVTANATFGTSGVFQNFPMNPSASTAVAHGSNPSATTAGLRVDVPANRHGVPFHIGGHPNIVTVSASYTSTQADVAVISVSGGTKIVLTSLAVYADGGGTGPLDVQLGFGASTVDTAKAIIDHPGLVKGSGVVLGNGAGIIAIGADGEDLRIDATGFGTGDELTVCASYFTIES